MSNEEKKPEYLSQDAFLTKKNFATTRKLGYLEDDVDKWVAEALAQNEQLVNNYNDIVYKYLLLEAEYENFKSGNTPEDAVEHVDVDVELTTVPDENVTEVNTELENEVATLRDYVAQLQESNTQQADLLEQYKVALDEAQNVNNTPVSVDLSNVSDRVKSILQSASDEAAEHVNRSLERVEQIERDTKEEVANTLSEANSEAERIKERAVADASEAREEYENLKKEKTALLDRLEQVHTNALEDIKKFTSSI